MENNSIPLSKHNEELEELKQDMLDSFRQGKEQGQQMMLSKLHQLKEKYLKKLKEEIESKHDQEYTSHNETIIKAKLEVLEELKR